MYRGFGAGLFPLRSNILYCSSDVCMDQLFYQFLRPFNDRIRHTGQFGNLNAVTFICAAFYDFSEKYNIVPFFFDCDTLIIDPGQFSFQFRKLMIMGGKQCFGTQNPGITDVFHDGPGNGQAIKGAGSSSDFIQD